MIYRFLSQKKVPGTLGFQFSCPFRPQCVAKIASTLGLLVKATESCVDMAIGRLRAVIDGLFMFPKNVFQTELQMRRVGCW